MSANVACEDWKKIGNYDTIRLCLPGRLARYGAWAEEGLGGGLAMFNALLYTSNWLRRELSAEHMLFFEQEFNDSRIGELEAVWGLYSILYSWTHGVMVPTPLLLETQLSLVPKLLRDRVLSYLNEEPTPKTGPALVVLASETQAS